ncbi:D-alanine--D-alanine ligase [hydrothermal vent metagenome]|uniref:D-alanine--D-alanine ligase n=1 Tax=hydrothermal vent metagenome TaxID=652676 RepID=A0A1W1BPZ3_9ZZZZ
MIAVLMGGWSAEREISLQSGEAVFQALQQQNIDCFKFDLTKENINNLWIKNFDKAFIVLHGRGGEDGFIQRELEQRNIAYTGSGVEVSQLAMDKVKTKYHWLAQNIPTPEVKIADDKIPTFPLPWAVKPALEGSSLGISKVTEVKNLNQAIKHAKQFDKKIMIEQWIEGDEYTIAILNNTALPVIKLQTNNVFYDYQAKYQTDETQYICPCGLSLKKENELQQLALSAARSIGIKTWARIDIMLDKKQNPYLLEINTVPGMTSHSLVPMAAKAAGISFEQLVLEILNG